MKPLCIYHGNCADGFTAAWAARKALGEMDFHAGVYQNPPPDVFERDVLIVDFSYKRPVLEEMAARANSILILDHHKTAAEDLAGLRPAASTWTQHLTNAYQDRCEGVTKSLSARFDMERAGARITWDFFFPNTPPPTLLLHVEDRDLWRFALAKTREIQANVFSYPYSFDIWDQLMGTPVEELALAGEAIERKHFKDVRELLGVVTRTMMIRGHAVPVANLPYTLTSDAGHLLAKGNGTDDQPEHPFAACYWDTPQGRVFSLRSAKGGIDVGAVAAEYGGGGHPNASGFRVPFSHELANGAVDPVRAEMTKILAGQA